ncbi:hypothetical protein V1289_009704 [Bradyrhizobium sp. AZCC 2289]
MTNSFLRIVAGLDVPLQAASNPTAAPAPHQPTRKRKVRAPYKERQPIEYQDGLPIIDRTGEQDEIFRFIAQHREAAAHYDRCVTVEQEAEGKVSDSEFFYLKNNTSNAFEQMMLFARCVILQRPTTRRGRWRSCRALPQGCGRWAASSIPRTRGNGHEQRGRISRRRAG